MLGELADDPVVMDTVRGNDDDTGYLTGFPEVTGAVNNCFGLSTAHLPEERARFVGLVQIVFNLLMPIRSSFHEGIFRRYTGGHNYNSNREDELLMAIPLFGVS
jgi:hypothetical protein